MFRPAFLSRRGCCRAAIAALCAAFTGDAGALPARRIMSINLCADLPLLMLVPKQRIASITYLAHPAVARLMPGADAGVARNHGAAEEVLRDKPDLILAGPAVTPVIRRLAALRGTPILEVSPAEDFGAIRRQITQLGAALDAPERAAALIAAMDAQLARLAVDPPARRLRVVAWGGGGAAPGHGTLTDAIITAAGAENIAARAGAPYASFGLEELLAARPDAILLSTGGYDQPSLHQGLARHPLLRRAFAGRLIDDPEEASSCGLPQAAARAAALRRLLTAIPSRTAGR